MTDAIGSAANPLRVAILGSGPAGFYACEELLKQDAPHVTVDLFDRLPTPFGLVRGGVAPDHQKIKSVIRLYERTARRDGFRFFGNVAYGQDVSLADLLGHYHQVLFCTGAESDRRMGIPGEDLAGSWPATAFVGWYNGHPDYRDLVFDLDVESAAVVGIGNVAMDVARILAKPVDELGGTDIAEHALEALRKSRIRTIHLLGRRGPAQAAFTNPEIRELCSIPGCDLLLRPQDLELDEPNLAYLKAQKDPTAQRNVDIMTEHLGRQQAGEVGGSDKTLHLWFYTSPVEVLGEGSVQGLKLERNRLEPDDRGNLRARGTGETETIDTNMVFRSIGYRGTALPDVPFDEGWGTIPNTDGRVTTERDGEVLPRLYVAGWIKRGPSGVIGTNKPDAIATVKAMLDDMPALPAEGVDTDPEALPALLEGRGVRAVSFADWERLDALEVERGKPSGKPREKFTRIQDMLDALA